MRWSHFLSAVTGGLIVAGGLVISGLAGPRRTTIVYEPPTAAQTGFASASGTSLNDLYQNDAPAVVLVSAKIVEPVPTERVPSPSGSASVSLHGTSTGTGFLVDRHGDIVTSYRVIAGAERNGGVTVTFENNRAARRSASVIAVDEAHDIAILRVQPSQLPAVTPLQFGPSTLVRVGDPALAIGNPFGIGGTFANGIVSALQHQIVAANGQTIDNVIQTDLTLFAGDEGGPLLSANTGKVIGINAEVDAVVGAGGATQPLWYAIPSDVAKAVLGTVAHQTAIQVAYLGVGSSSGKPSKSGAVVQRVDPHGPAKQAGIKVGDVIVKVDNIRVDSISDVLTVVSTLSPQSRIDLELRHHGHLRQVPVLLEGRTIGPGGS